jgi:NADH-quinone oxidoreductase subunit H
MVNRLKYVPHRIFLIVLVAILMLCGLIFLIPAVNASIISFFWFVLKVAVVVYTLIWVRGTFPRFRYDQLMNIGWKVMIPVALAAIAINAVLGLTHS